MQSAERDSKATLTIGNSIADMKSVFELVETFGGRHGLPQAVTNDLNLCLDEILNNTISYGYDDGAPHFIRVTVSLDADAVIAEIQDDGKPFDPRRNDVVAAKGNLHTRKVGGLGILFVNTLMDEVDYIREGKHNRLKLKKKLPKSGSQGHNKGAADGFC